MESEGPDRERGAAHTGATPARPLGFVATAESGERRPLDEVLEGRADPVARRMAERIAHHLSVRPKSRDRAVARGSGRLSSVPYRYGSDDIDLDRTL